MNPADKRFTIVAGQALCAALHAEQVAKVRVTGSDANGPLYDSEGLCRLHAEQDRRGILGAELVKSIYGWSVRYDSGLQNFGIIAGARYGQVDGTYEDAVRFAQQWAAEDPTRRYVWVRMSAIEAAAV